VALALALGLAVGLTLSLMPGPSASRSTAPSPQERALLASLAKATPATPGDPIYAGISTICGPTTVLGTSCLTDVNSVSFGAIGGESINFSDVSLQMPMNKVTPPMFAALTGRSVLGTATLEFVATNAGKEYAYMKITLSNVTIDSISLASGGSNPDISASLKYTQIKVTYYTGAVASTFCWNLGTLSSC
jgi:type VI protein secretion system component Hcp